MASFDGEWEQPPPLETSSCDGARKAAPRPCYSKHGPRPAATVGLTPGFTSQGLQLVSSPLHASEEHYSEETGNICA